MHVINPHPKGALLDSEQFLLLGLAHGQRGIGTHVLEVGTFQGRTTTMLARALPSHKVVTVGMPAGRQPALPSNSSDAQHYGVTAYFPPDAAPRIAHYECDSVDMRFTPDVKLALSFIDGGHSRAYVQHDFKLALGHSVPGSLIVFHDYGTDNALGITEVRLAVDELVLAYPHCHWHRCASTSLAWCYVERYQRGAAVA